MDDEETGYAPLSGIPEDTHCSFCGVGAEASSRGWMVASAAAICPECIQRGVQALEAPESADR